MTTTDGPGDEPGDHGQAGTVNEPSATMILLLMLLTVVVVLGTGVVFYLHGVSEVSAEEHGPFYVVGGEASPGDDNGGFRVFDPSNVEPADAWESPTPSPTGPPPPRPVRVDVYVDLADPGSARLVAADATYLHQAVKDERIELYLHPLALFDDSTGGASTRAADAFVVVTEHDSVHTMPFAEALLEHAAASGGRSLTDDEIARIASGLGVEEYASMYLADHWFDTWVHRSTGDASVDPVLAAPSGVAVPTVVVGGVRCYGAGEPAVLESAVAAARADGGGPSVAAVVPGGRER